MLSSILVRFVFRMSFKIHLAEAGNGRQPTTPNALIRKQLQTKKYYRIVTFSVLDIILLLQNTPPPDSQQFLYFISAIINVGL